MQCFIVIISYSGHPVPNFEPPNWHIGWNRLIQPHAILNNRDIELAAMDEFASMDDDALDEGLPRNHGRIHYYQRINTNNNVHVPSTTLTDFLMLRHSLLPY